ncbi:MAG TPA: hypothetical protein VKW06_12385 [Candidatus Angelobacter sp.]|nr:hypothetical protein [Candidatus Angelobacter sp.]
MSVQSAIHTIFAAQLVLLGLLCGVLLIRKGWKSFPVFAAYSLFNLISGLVEFFIYKYPKAYFYAFIVIESVAIILGLAVVYEVFVHLFSAQQALRRLATWLLGVAVLALGVLGFIVIQMHGVSLKNVGAGIIAAEEAARVLEVGSLSFLFVCSGTFGLHWRQPVFGIALGLSVFTTFELILIAMRAYFGVNPAAGLNIARMLAFGLGLLIWIGYLVAPERVQASDGIPERSQLEQWNRAVMELIHQ